MPFAWLDGECVPAAAATVPLMALTLHYGVGVFEGIRAYDGDHGPAVFRLREHVARLFRSARLLRLELPCTEDQLTSAKRACSAASAPRCRRSRA